MVIPENYTVTTRITYRTNTVTGLFVSVRSRKTPTQEALGFGDLPYACVRRRAGSAAETRSKGIFRALAASAASSSA